MYFGTTATWGMALPCVAFGIDCRTEWTIRLFDFSFLAEEVQNDEFTLVKYVSAKQQRAPDFV